MNKNKLDASKKKPTNCAHCGTFVARRHFTCAGCGAVYQSQWEAERAKRKHVDPEMSLIGLGLAPVACVALFLLWNSPFLSASIVFGFFASLGFLQRRNFKRKREIFAWYK